MLVYRRVTLICREVHELQGGSNRGQIPQVPKFSGSGAVAWLLQTEHGGSCLQGATAGGGEEACSITGSCLVIVFFFFVGGGWVGILP